MIKWISTETPPTEYSMTKEYFVTCEYNGQGNVNGRLTLLWLMKRREERKLPHGAGKEE